MSAFPPQFLDELRLRLPLADFLSRRVRLVKSGIHTKALCPFHQEKSPSFVLYNDHYHCFGCGAHGDIITFTMQADRLSFPDAVEKLAGEAGLPVPTTSPQERAAAAAQARGFDALLAARDFFIAQLRGTPLQYLRDRGLDDETIERFMLGYSPADSQALITTLRGQGFADDLLIQFGLAKKSDRGDGIYSFFRDRVMFPVTDRHGRTVAFGARILPGHGEGPKYINSGDHPLFTKGKLLYNLPAARQAALDGQPIIVTEGYLDVIACSAAGLPGTVAPLGTAMTEIQLQLLWRLLPAHGGRHVVPLICFDGDSAGRTAASRALDRLLPHLSPEQSARFAFLPEGQDPDSLIRANGLAGFQDILHQAIGPAEWLWQRATQHQNFDRPEDRAALRRTLRQEVSEIRDADTRQQYENELNARFEKAFPSASMQPARGEWQKNFGQKKSGPMVKPTTTPSVSAGEKRKQQLLLMTLIIHPHLLDEAQEFLAHLEIADPALHQLQQALAATPTREREALWDELRAGGHQETLDALWHDQQLRLSKFAFDPARAEDAAAFIREIQGQDTAQIA
jgi:DNA primase